MTTRTKRPKPLNQYDRNRSGIDFDATTCRTKQSFKAECDINNIMRKFQKNGIIDHVNKHAERYGDMTGFDFMEAQQIIADGKTMFEELPSSVRKEFAGPAEFLDFVHNPKNAERIVEMGLATKRPEEPPRALTKQDLLDVFKPEEIAPEAPKSRKKGEKPDPTSTVST